MKQKAWLVMNHFIESDKFKSLSQRLLEVAGELSLLLMPISNLHLLESLRIDSAEEPEALWTRLEKPDFVLFWDKDERLAFLLEELGIRLFNRAEAIRICDDKALTFIKLRKSGIPMPKTFLAPLTFRSEGYPFERIEPYLRTLEEELSYPLIVKECYGSFGQQVYSVAKREELEQQMRELGNKPYLFQELVESSRGFDYRLQMVGKACVAACKRENPNDYRANVTNGGTMRPWRADEASLTLAREVMDVLELDFAGIDLLDDGKGGYLLCEVNSNAHFLNLDHCCGTDTGRAILSYCMDQGHE